MLNKTRRVSSKMSLGLKASDCVYFKVRNPYVGKSWEELGIPTYAKATRLFSPDLTKLRGVNTEAIGILADLTRKMDDSQIRILCYLLTNVSNLRTKGFAFGQPVYINMSYPRIENVGCYRKGRVVSIDQYGNLQLIGNINNLGEEATLITIPKENVLTRSKFNKLKEKLIEEGKGKLSAKQKREHMLEYKPVKVLSKVEYEELQDVPTIDSIPDSWYSEMEINDDENTLTVSSKKSGKKAKSKVGNPVFKDIKLKKHISKTGVQSISLTN